VVNPESAAPGAQNFLICANGRMFLVNSVSNPYVENPQQVADSLHDERLKQAFAAHRAWLSVDLYVHDEPPTQEEKPEIYNVLGPLLAEFAGDDCLAIYCLEIDACNVYTPEIADALRSGNVLGLFEEPTQPPIVNVPPDDPRMIAAVEEGRRRWPEFVAAFRANQDPEIPFGVKAEFVDGDAGEFMWLTVQSIGDDSITGVLGNSPAFVKNVQEGDVVTVSLASLNDWVYFAEGEQVGGFTMKVMEEELRKEGNS
jgi:uncharacterized protein YegJ (DUF2314 family)